MLKRTVSKYLLKAAAILVLLMLYGSSNPTSQNNTYRVVFYNVENLFDTFDDPLTRDEEFLPRGDRFWSKKRYTQKLNRISQVIMSVGGWQPPVLVGLCEVENLFVLEELLAKTPLGRLGYRIIHKESPDRRGIDVAMIYLSSRFEPISYKAITVADLADDSFKTRDILYVKGLIQTDTLHIFVNHWPSKYGGVAQSEPKRFLAGSTLKQHTDSILAVNSMSKVLIMGDFNDTPQDVSLLEHLKSLPVPQTVYYDSLIYNLSYSLAQKGVGSHKYQAHWSLIDHITVSGSMLNLQNRGLQTNVDAFKVFDAPFLLERDKTHLGQKPFRTYVGFKYNNGFSDHLPVYIDLFFHPVGQ